MFFFNLIWIVFFKRNKIITNRLKICTNIKVNKLIISVIFTDNSDPVKDKCHPRGMDYLIDLYYLRRVLFMIDSVFNYERQQVYGAQHPPSVKLIK